MSDRLKEIWSAFERRTTRELVGRGVEGMEAPSRRARDADLEDLLPLDYAPPAEAAFAALRAQLKTAEARANRNARRKSARGVDGAARAGFAVDPPPGPLATDLSADMAGHIGAPEGAIDMIRGLRATEMRTDRVTPTYAAYAASAKAAGKKKRRKFLGLF